MTITVTPQPLNLPPRNQVAVSVTPGYVMSAVNVWRNDSNGRTPIRTQPASGFDARTVFDYEAPYGELITYDWAATYSSGFVTIFNELWASTAAWGTLLGSWNVSAGKLRNNTSGDAILARNITPQKARVTIASFTESVASSTLMRIRVASVIGSTSYVQLVLNAAGVGTVQWRDGGSVVSIGTLDFTAPIVIDYNATSVTVSGTGGTYNIPLNSVVGYIEIFASSVAANGMQVGAFKVEGYGTPTNIAETSSPVTLNSDNAWLLAPQATSLSIPLTKDSATAAGIESVDAVENDTNTTVHKILGSRQRTTVTNGPRSDDDTGMTVYTTTSDERIALRGLLATDIPIMVNIPTTWDTDFNSGFYQVGKTVESRPNPAGNDPWRLTYLPLTKVASPIVDVENTGWSYAELATTEVSYADLLFHYASYADLAAHVRT